MPINVLQENGNINLSGTATTVSQSFTVSSGSSLHVLVAYVSGNNATLSLSDGVNTYAGPLDTVSVSNFYIASQFIANSISSGSITIQATSSAAATFYIGLWAREIASTAGLDGTQHGSLTTASSVLTANALLGPSLTSSTSGLASSFAWWQSGTSNFGTVQPSAGTGYTLGSSALFPNPGGLASSESIVGSTSGPALWTAPLAGQTYTVFTALFKQIATVATPLMYNRKNVLYFI